MRNSTELKSSSSSSSWPWPSCHQPRTLSFRATTNNIDTTFETSESFFTVSPESASFSTSEESKKCTASADSIETVIRGLRSDRLFFEPEETSSILDANKTEEAEETESSESVAEGKSLPCFKDSAVLLSMESKDPYDDFRKSMEEMVAAHAVKDWEGLQELLCWYLKVNDKTNHGYIVGAFVDLLVASSISSFSSSSSCSSSCSVSHSPSSPLSFYSSSLSSSCSTRSRCVSCLMVEEEVVITPSTSSLLTLEKVREEIDPEDESSFSSSIST